MVEGWLSPTTASMISRLLIEQVNGGLRGDVCEIGVHHGKLFLILANATVADEHAVAVDVFDDQDKNIDKSGCGNRLIFEQNLALHAPAAAVEIVQESSLDLARHGFLSRRFRFISIDGGHTASTVANDLQLAERTLIKGGIVALDDILSSHWTGVLTGLSVHVARGGTLVPCALLPNKLLLTTDDIAATQCKALLQRLFPLALAKTGLEFLSGTVDTYEEHQHYSREDNRNLRFALDKLERERDELETQLGAMREDVAELQLSRNTLTGQLAAMEAHVVKLRTSTSWRMTGPLRRIVAFVRSKADTPPEER